MVREGFLEIVAPEQRQPEASWEGPCLEEGQAAGRWAQWLQTVQCRAGLSNDLVLIALTLT